jgi:hypothetical protein
MKVTPLKAVPIIPKATKYHFEFLLAMKNVELSEEFFEVKWAININTKK